MGGHDGDVQDRSRGELVTSTTTIESEVWDALRGVMDPEIPAVSVVDMGMIEKVSTDGGKVRVVVLPTFTGCPAISVILDEVRRAAVSVPQVEEAVVETSFTPPWTTDRITPYEQESR